LSEYAQNVHTDQDYNAWIAAINEHPVWVDYYLKSLVYLYELVFDNPERNAKVKAGIEAYLAGKAIAMDVKASHGVLPQG
jgi:hypothetical protein